MFLFEQKLESRPYSTQQQPTVPPTTTSQCTTRPYSQLIRGVFRMVASEPPPPLYFQKKVNCHSSEFLVITEGKI